MIAIYTLHTGTMYPCLYKYCDLLELYFEMVSGFPRSFVWS